MPSVMPGSHWYGRCPACVLRPAATIRRDRVSGRLITSATAVAALALCLAACGSGSTAPGAGITTAASDPALRPHPRIVIAVPPGQAPSDSVDPSEQTYPNV